MDIAKIRKKALTEGRERQPEERPQASPEERPEEKPAERGESGSGTEAGEPLQEPPAEGGPQEHEGREEGPEDRGPGEGGGSPAGPVAEEGPAPRYGGEDADVSELLTFSIGSEEFAFRVSEVEEIIRYQRITIVPTVPGYMAGITSLRGKIIPVIDLGARLALRDISEGVSPRAETDADGIVEGKGKIIILSGPQGLIGAIIDKVIGVVRLPDDFVLEPPAHLTEDETKFIEGVVIVDKRFISIIRSVDALTIEVG